MAGIRERIKVVWVAFLSLLVVTSSGGILLNVHTCLTHSNHYIQLFSISGHCGHRGTCCLVNHSPSCCSLKTTGDPVDRHPKWVPLCCKDQLLQLTVGNFLAEQSADKVLKWVLGYNLCEINVQIQQVEVIVALSATKESVRSKAPPHSHWPAVLCVFLI